MAKRDYYDVLGVPRSAAADEIKKAHRKLARTLHPDVNKESGAAAKFAEVQEAYDVLGDAERKKKYDQFGHNQPGASGPGPSADDLYEQFRRGGGNRNVRPEDFQEAADAGGSQFGDVFDQLFGGRGPFGRAGGRKRHPAAAERGQDVEHPVTLSFEQAARGTSLSLRLNLGTSTESIDVKVPAGVKEGSRVRVKGKGDRAAGTPGDLFIVVSVTPHAYFRRSGLDILLDLPLSLYEAMLGTKLSVPTLDGPVTLTIPPGTGSGAKLRIKGRGVKRAEEMGDQFCVVKIVLPKNLSPDEQAMVGEIQKNHPVQARDGVGW